jgi:site-specific DNA-cytosine methylase
MKESKTDKVVQVGQLLANHSQAYTLYDANGLCPTIASGQKRFGGLPTWIKYETNMADNNQIELPSELKGKKFRIRKLTPRECFRLMGVDDKDIDKIQAAGVSNSAQYKLAGNSIVVDVLFHIFRKMFIETEPDNDGKPVQLSLF